jgi:hypothetical protein
MIRIASATLVVLLLVAIYGWMNASVSLDHARQQQLADRSRSELLKQLLVLTNRHNNRSELTKIINDHFVNGHIVKFKQDSIEVDGLVLRFKGDDLSGVVFLGEDSDQ